MPVHGAPEPARDPLCISGAQAPTRKPTLDGVLHARAASPQQLDLLVRQVLREMRERTLRLQVFGSYPAGEETSE